MVQHCANATGNPRYPSPSPSPSSFTPSKVIMAAATRPGPVWCHHGDRDEPSRHRVLVTVRKHIWFEINCFHLSCSGEIVC